MFYIVSIDLALQLSLNVGGCDVELNFSSLACLKLSGRGKHGVNDELTLNLSASSSLGMNILLSRKKKISLLRLKWPKCNPTWSWWASVYVPGVSFPGHRQDELCKGSDQKPRIKSARWEGSKGEDLRSPLCFLCGLHCLTTKTLFRQLSPLSHWTDTHCISPTSFVECPTKSPCVKSLSEFSCDSQISGLINHALMCS